MNAAAISTWLQTQADIPADRADGAARELTD
jgi:hypothetical protein